MKGLFFWRISLFTLEINGRSMYRLVFFFVALAEVHWCRLSFHGNKIQQLVELGTVVFVVRCYLPQNYIAIRQGTVNRGWIKLALVDRKPVLTSCVAWKRKMYDGASFRVYLWFVASNCSYQEDIYMQNSWFCLTKRSRAFHAWWRFPQHYRLVCLFVSACSASVSSNWKGLAALPASKLTIHFIEVKA